MCPTGGSPRTETARVLNYMNGTTAPINTRTVGSVASLSAPVSISSCEPMAAMPSLFGEISSTIPAKKVSTAPYSGMKGRSGQASLSDRLTPLLISSGLVRGIIPMSMREMSNLRTPDFAFLQLDTGSVASQKAGFSSLKRIHAMADAPFDRTTS